jgi:hypothetical protein
MTYRFIWIPPLIVNRSLGSDQEEVIETPTESEPLTLQVTYILHKAKGTRSRYLITIGGGVRQRKGELLLTHGFRVSKGVINAKLVRGLDSDRLLTVPYFDHLLDIDLVPLTVLLCEADLFEETAELSRGAIHNRNLSVALDEYV